MINAREMTDSDLIEELERRRMLEPRMTVRLDFVSSLNFCLAYLVVSAIAILIVVGIILLVMRSIYGGLVNFLAHYGLSFQSLLI